SSYRFMNTSDCIFCKIVSGEVPSALVYEDEQCLAFNDLNPQAPTHILVIPRVHIDSLDTVDEGHKGLIGHLLFAGAGIARKKGFADEGYRIVINTNRNGGQTVFHL